jgi:hypothetical protein
MWKDVSRTLRVELAEAAIKRELPACNRAVFKLYDLNCEERSAFGGNGQLTEMSQMTSLKTFVTALAGHVAAEAARLG